MFDKSGIVPCVDWFRGIVPIDDIRTFADNLESIDNRLSFNNFVYDGKTLLNYKKRYSHIMVPSLTFAFNPIDELDSTCTICNPTHNNKFILFSLSGDAIRFLGHDTLKALFEFLSSVGTKCTRIDLALDFFDKENSIIPLMLEGCSNFMAPKAGDLTVSGKLKRDPVNWKCYVNQYPTGETSFGYDIGNHGSDHGMIRIYDKKYECLFGRNRRFSKELVQNRDYWYRAELELHNSPYVQWANEAFYNLVSSDFNVYSSFGHCIDQFITFTVLKYDNHTIYDDISEWQLFLDFLIQSIHFVQLVREKYVHKDLDYMWQQLSHYSVMLSALIDVGKTDPVKYRKIIQSGRQRRRSEPSKQIRYACINEVFN